MLLARPCDGDTYDTSVQRVRLTLDQAESLQLADEDRSEIGREGPRTAWS